MTVLDQSHLCYILVTHTMQLCISNILCNVTDFDYTTGPYSITFCAGSTRALVIVPLVDDDLLEGAEDFTLSIDLSSLPSCITTGVHDKTLVTINDNDCKFFLNSVPTTQCLKMYIHSYIHFVNDCTSSMLKGLCAHRLC